MRNVFGLGLLGAACLIACGSSGGGGGGGANGGDGSGGADSTAGTSASAGSGNHHAGASSSSGGDAGEGGAPDITPVVSAAKPHAAGGLVAGGVVGHSKHFTGVFSLGAAPGGNGLTTSKSQQLRGGVLGASQQ